jgi:predicted O-linked N-acetylglucosamine transferase (SPINDLY family)
VRAAEALYRDVLRLDPAYAAAHLNLGAALMDQRRYHEALQSFETGLQYDSHNAIAHSNLGNALFELGHSQRALGCYDRAIALNPRYARALSNRSGVLLSLRNVRGALESAEAALSLQPELAEALNNRGNALLELEQPREALLSLNRALQLRPDWPLALANRCSALLALGQLDEALADANRSVQLEPADPVALNNLGNVLRSQQRLQEAVECYDRAIAAQPGFMLAHYNRGHALMDLRRPEAALDSFREALRLDPRHAESLNGCGMALLRLQRLEEASEALAKAVEIRPGLPYAAGLMLYALNQQADWTRYTELARAVTTAVQDGEPADEPFSHLGLSASAEAQSQCASRYVEDKFPSRVSARSFTHAHERIRVAYLSDDLRDHALSHLMVGVFEQHDRARFETVAVSFSPASDSQFGRRVEQAFDHFVDVSSFTDAQVALFLQNLEVDIAVDLMGFTRGMRLGILAKRPAPVQVTFLGFPGTLSAHYVDYLIADHFVVPPESRRHYAERIAYLPECFQPNDDRRALGARVTRAQAGLPESATVLCSFGSTFKATPVMFDIWCELLRERPGSVLWLLAEQERTRANLRREAAARSVDPARIIFAERIAYEQHLQRLHLADLFLDTFPFNAGANGSDALWAGVPVLTCAGEAFASRMAGSLLHALGLPELITHSLEEYRQRAKELTHDADRLVGLRTKLAARRFSGGLFDTRRFCRHLERAYERMHERSARGESPTDFTVDPETP